MSDQQKFNPNDLVPMSCYYIPMGGPLPPRTVPDRDGGAMVVTHAKPALGGQTWLEEGTKFPESFDQGRVVAWLMLPT